MRARNLFLFSFPTLLLAACATPAKQENIGISAVERYMYSAGQALSGKVSVRSVVGGKDTNPLWTSEIGSADFAAALRDSLETARLLHPRGMAAYTLDAALVEVKQPMAAFTMTVHTTVEYTLPNAATRETVLQETIVADGSARTSDPFSGVKRLRLATERAAQANIQKLIDLLYNYGG